MSENVQNIRQIPKLYPKNVKNWKVKLIARGKTPAAVKIQGAIFQ